MKYSQDICKLLQEAPIVAAVKDTDGLQKCLSTDSSVVFVLFGNVCDIPSIVKKIKQSGKHAFVHVDLIDGLSNHQTSVDYIKTATEADGIISTKPTLIKYAKSLGLLTVQRFFVIDSISLKTVKMQISLGYADSIEILPGVLPNIIREIVSEFDIPIIAGGLIRKKGDIVAVLSAGATAVSSTNSEIWNM